MDLSGQVALVTGGSSGVGLAIAEALGESGASVHAVSRSTGVDVTDLASVERAVADIGPIGLLVNNAGAFEAIGPAWEVDPEAWRGDVEVSLIGAFHCSR